MKYAELVKQGQSKLFKSGINDADYDAWILMEKICSISKTDYFTKMQDEVPDEMVAAYFEAIDKRITHYPLQYIVGEWEFMGLKFIVNENVLIPRQDTEVLVETAIRIIENEFENAERKIEILDMCTGSGCIGISLAKFCENVEITAVDLSEAALAVAKENAGINDIDNIKFLCSDLYQKLGDEVNEVYRKFDIIISNPPYINTKDIDTLMPEVRDYEPRMALDGDEDGLKFYRNIIFQSRNYLKQNGCILFEIGCEQGNAVKEIFEKNQYKDIEVIRDLSGLERVVVGRYEKQEEFKEFYI